MDMENLGYIVILLKQIPKEKDVPREIVLNLSMKLFFDFSRGFGDVSAVDMELKAFPDEGLWTTSPNGAARNSFWQVS